MNSIEQLQDQAWKTPSCYTGFNPIGDFLIVSKTRDSSLLEQCNFDEILKELEALQDPNEENCVYTFTASHWACGWVEYLMIDKNAPNNILQVASEIICALSDYPVFNDEKYSELQYNEVFNYWENLSLADRIELCNDNEVSIFSARYADQVPCEVQQYLMDTIV